MRLIAHAMKEMELAWPESEEMQGMVKANVLELMEVFANQGHSGSSAPYVLNVFHKLAMFETISPLTGEDSEWNLCGGGVYQNNRCGEVFKDGAKGEAYWISGRIFRDPDGHTYTNRDSHVPVSFPWTQPEREIVNVDANGEVIVVECKLKKALRTIVDSEEYHGDSFACDFDTLQGIARAALED